MHTKLKKILLLGLALSLGLQTQATKPDNGITPVLICKILMTIFNLMVVPNPDNTQRLTEGEEKLETDDNTHESNQPQAILSPEEQAAFNNQLLKTARNGDVEAIKHWIKAGADVNTVKPQSNVTPLTSAITQGHVEAIKLLMQAGAKIHTADHQWAVTPLTLAVRNGQVAVIEALIPFVLDANTWNAVIANDSLAVNQRLILVMVLLGNSVNIRWTHTFTTEAIIAFLTAPNAEAIAPIAELVNPMIQEANPDVRQRFADGLQFFLHAIIDQQMIDIETGQAIGLTNDQQTLIQGLIEQLYAGPATKSARKIADL
jgi:ankyrin repeat protein